MSGKGFGKWRVQQGTERSELPSLFSERGEARWRKPSPA